MKGSPPIIHLPRRVLFRLLHSWRKSHTIITHVSGQRIKICSLSPAAESCYADCFDLVGRAIIDRLIVQGSTVLDVGANVGYFTCLFAKKVGRSGKVIAFEPTPSTFQVLSENVSLNNFQDRVELHNVAVSDRSDTASFNTFAEEVSVYNSFGVTAAYGMVAVDRIVVKTVCLDEIIGSETAKNVSFIKIDVEGWEHKTVTGATSFLRSADQIVVMIELSELAARQCGHSVADTLLFMEQLGYTAYRALPPNKLSPLSDAERESLIVGPVSYQDVFFAKASMMPILKTRGLT